ncbi:MAG: LapA family protein [Calditrichaeota bacterium]|nr:LapA family protein [Calditrichota bacterium]RQW08130.1 MAG: LapA family protein [Calditrichota bacterium]
MKIIENLIKILIVLLLLFVLIQNSSQKIDLQLFTLYYPNINLAIILLITLGIGAVLGALMLSLNLIQSRSEIRNLQKKNKQLTKELENLRNISIEEIPDGEIQSPEENIKSKEEN